MKKYLKNIRSKFGPEKFSYFDSFISALIFIVLIAFLFYMTIKMFKIVIDVVNFEFEHMIHNVIYFIVLVKVYKILVSYLRFHHISVKYILEIAIIAPMIEVIFMVDAKPWFITVIFIIFSFLSLFLYLLFYDKIKKLD